MLAQGQIPVAQQQIPAQMMMATPQMIIPGAPMMGAPAMMMQPMGYAPPQMMQQRVPVGAYPMNPQQYQQ